MSIGDRIKNLRKELNITQSEFGKKIGVARNTVTSYEGNHRNLTNRTINDICREFNVEPLWLTTGEGEMFIQTCEDDAIIELMNKALSNEDEFLRDLFMSFSKLDVEHWKALKELMNTYVDIQNSKNKK